MTKKDYILIAKAINEAVATAMQKDEPCFPIYRVADNLANDLYQQNPRFDRNKFLTAAGFPVFK